MKSSVAAAALLMGSGALNIATAQDQDAAEPRTLNTVVVTAEKRAESIQDVGIAISAVSGEELLETKTVEPRDLFSGMPNVSVASNATAGQLQFSIRGVNFLSFSPISVQPVLVFQDEVVLNSPQGAGLFIFDLERVEVLRGPQNTLYGRNTTGGAVNFVTRKPDIGGDANGYFNVSLGNFGANNVDAAYGAPINDKAAFRLAVQSVNHDGYWRNVATRDRQGERDQLIGRAQLAIDATDTLNLLFDAHGGFSNGGQRGIKTHGLFADTGFGGPICADIDLDDLETSCLDGFGGATLSDNDVVNSDLRNDRDDIEVYGGSVTAKLDWGENLVTLISAYEGNTYDHWEDADGLPLPFVNFRQKSDTDQWSHELRLSSADDKALRWIVGAYAFYEDTTFETAVPIALFDPAASFSDNNLVDHETTMYSVYGQVDVDVTEKLTVTGGLRYVNEEKEGRARYQFAVGLDGLDINNANAFTFNNLVNQRAPGSFIDAPFGESWDLWGGKIGAEYAASENLLLYGSISRGEKAGQFTDAPDAIANGGFFTPADPEEVLAYEAGLKGTWLDGRWITNLAVFHNEYDNQQQQVTLPGPVSTVVNVASSTTSGIEFDTQFAPGDGWFASLSVGVLDTEVKEDSLSALTGGALSIRPGRELTNSPELTGSASLQKEFFFSNGHELKLRLDASYTDERNFDLLEIAVDPVYVTDPSYTLFDAAAIYRFGDQGQYSASIFGKNLTDETYYTLMQEFDIGNAILFTGTPRTYGVSFGVEF